MLLTVPILACPMALASLKLPCLSRCPRTRSRNSVAAFFVKVVAITPEGRHPSRIQFLVSGSRLTDGSFPLPAPALMKVILAFILGCILKPPIRRAPNNRCRLRLAFLWPFPQPAVRILR